VQHLRLALGAVEIDGVPGRVLRDPDLLREARPLVDQHVQVGVDDVDALANRLERRLDGSALCWPLAGAALRAGRFFAFARATLRPSARTGCRQSSAAWRALGFDRCFGVDQRVGEVAARLVEQVGDVESGLREARGDLADMFGTFSFAIATRLPPTRGSTASGKLTELRTLPFSRKSRSVSATMIAQFSSASPVDAPRCGNATTRG